MADPIPTDLLDQRLPDWYRALTIDLDGDLMAARKSTIIDLASGINHENAAAIAAYANGRLKRGEDLIDWIRKTAREYDGTFAVSVREREPRVLLSCAIAHRLATGPEDAVSTRLGLLCKSARFLGLRSAANRQDLAALAERHLLLTAERNGAPVRAAKTSTLTTIRQSLKALPEFPDDPSGVVNSTMRAWVEAAVEVFEVTARRLDSVDRKLARAAMLLTERQEQTGWLLDEYCEIAGSAWSTVGKERAPLYAATELGQLTSPPGLPTVGVMLKSTLLKAGENPKGQVDCLKAVESAAPRLEAWPEFDGDDLTPLTAAVTACRELGGKGWRSLAENRRGGGKLGTVSAQALAEQGHRELMIAWLGDG